MAWQFCPRVMVVFLIDFQLHFCVFAFLCFFLNANYWFSHIFVWPSTDIYGFLQKKFYKISNFILSQKTTMARSRHRRPLRLGAQAKCSVLLSKLHPSAVVDAHFPNCESQKCLKDLIAVRIDDATHGGRKNKICFFHITIHTKRRALMLEEILHHP